MSTWQPSAWDPTAKQQVTLISPGPVYMVTRWTSNVAGCIEKFGMTLYLQSALNVDVCCMSMQGMLHNNCFSCKI